MGVPVLEWFRDDDGWIIPDGRRGEFIAIVVAIPVFTYVATYETGLSSPTEHPVAAIAGIVCGFCYAVYWRERLCALVPGWARSVTMSTLFSGGLGFSLLQTVDLAGPTVLFVLAAGLTVLAIYSGWLLSPVHDGVHPSPRGVRPPSSLESDRSYATESDR